MAERKDAGRFLDRAPIIFVALFLEPPRFGGQSELLERAAKHACGNAAHRIAVPDVVDLSTDDRGLMLFGRAAFGCDDEAGRSEERRVGERCCSTCRSRWASEP